MPRKKQVIYNVTIYYDDLMNFWSMRAEDIYWTGFISKESLIEYCNKKKYKIIGEV